MKNHDGFEKLNTKKVQVKPFVYKKLSISEISARLLILLSVQILMLIFNKSYSSLIIVGLAVAGAFAASALDYLLTKRDPYTSLILIVQGIMIGLLLPEGYPAVTVFFISFFVLFISKYFFSGSENTWINMVAFALVVSWFIGRNFFPPFLISKNLLSLKNPSYTLIQNGVFSINSFDAAVTGFLNNHILNYIRVSLPEGYISLMWDNHSVIPAFRFNIITILSSIVLFADGAYSVLISAIYFFTYGLFVRLFVPLMNGGFFNQGDVLLAIFTSGTLFAGTFMIQWLGTVPKTILGKIIYGFAAGILAFLLMGCGTASIEMIFMVLICNILSLLINFFEENYNNRLLERVVSKANI